MASAAEAAATRKKLIAAVQENVRAVINEGKPAFNEDGSYDGAGFGTLVDSLVDIVNHGLRRHLDDCTPVGSPTPGDHPREDPGGDGDEDKPEGDPDLSWKFVSSLKELGQYIARVVGEATVLAEEDVDRVRVWLAQSLVEKRLSSFLGILTSSDEDLARFYQKDALLRHRGAVQSLRLWVTHFESSPLTNPVGLPGSFGRPGTSPSSLAAHDSPILRRMSITSASSATSLDSVASSPAGAFHRRRCSTRSSLASDHTDSALSTSPQYDGSYSAMSSHADPALGTSPQYGGSYDAMSESESHSPRVQDGPPKARKRLQLNGSAPSPHTPSSGEVTPIPRGAPISWPSIDGSDCEPTSSDSEARDINMFSAESNASFDGPRFSRAPSSASSGHSHNIVHIPLYSSDGATSEELERENRHFVVIEALISAMAEAQSHASSSEPFESEDLSDSDSATTPSRRRRLPRGWESAVLLQANSWGGLTESRQRLQTDLTALTPRKQKRSTDQEEAYAEEPLISDSIPTPTLLAVPNTPKAQKTPNRGHTRESSISSIGSCNSEMADWISVDMTPGKEVPRPNVPNGVVQPKDGFQPDFTESSTAEDIARGFLRSMTAEFPPLQLVVSDADVPQDLLPLPIVSFNDLQNEGEGWRDIVYQTDSNKSRMRGNEEWAPPRRQLIFTLHKKLPRKTAIALQNHRCTGCGLRVELNYVKRFRYCEYLGKYFCPSCHSKSVAIIPGRVLCKWDFKKYPISNFAAEFLNSIATEPMFELEALQPGMHRRIKALNAIREVRFQLYSIRNYLLTCRSGIGLLEALDNAPGHLVTTVEMYSLVDLINIHNGTLISSLQHLRKMCVKHISLCPLCQAKGFICELCNDDRDVLFPFEKHTEQCQKCGSVFHKKCFQKRPQCPRCERIRARRQPSSAK